MEPVAKLYNLPEGSTRQIYCYFIIGYSRNISVVQEAVETIKFNFPELALDNMTLQHYDAPHYENMLGIKFIPPSNKSSKHTNGILKILENLGYKPARMDYLKQK